MTLSIRAKVTIGTVIAVTVGLVLAGWLALRTVEQFELNRLTEDLQARGALLHTSLQPFLKETAPSDSSPALRTQVRKLAGQLRVRISVITRDGHIQADSAVSDATDRLPRQADRPEIATAWEKGLGTAIRRSGASGQRVLYLAKRVDGETDAGRLIRLALPLTTLEANLAMLKRALMVAVAVGFLCALALSPLFARSLTQPLSQMVGVAQQFAEGEFRQRLTTQQGDEVGALALALNHMADRLETTIREVSEDGAQLRAMLTAMVEGVMVLDANGTILQTNPALERMLLAPGIQARGRPYWEMIRHHELNELVSRVLATSEA